MPSDLYDVHTSDLVQTPCEIQVSQMSFTEADASTFNDLLDVQLSAVEGLGIYASLFCDLCMRCLCVSLYIYKLTL